MSKATLRFTCPTCNRVDETVTSTGIELHGEGDHQFSDAEMDAQSGKPVHYPGLGVAIPSPTFLDQIAQAIREGTWLCLWKPIDPALPATWPMWLNDAIDAVMQGTWLGCCYACEDSRGGRLCATCTAYANAEREFNASEERARCDEARAEWATEGRHC